MAWLNEWINLDKPGKDNTVCMYITPLAYQYLGHHNYCVVRKQCIYIHGDF